MPDLMRSTMEVGAIALTIFGLIFYLRPVIGLERAMLLRRAEGCAKATEFADRLTARRYISYWEFERALEKIGHLANQDQVDQVLAAQEARRLIKRAAARTDEEAL